MGVAVGGSAAPAHCAKAPAVSVLPAGHWSAVQPCRYTAALAA
jgi:hypothetical protein